GWLYRVAHHTALHARADAARRRQLERQAADMANPDPVAEAVWRELRPVLHEEVNRLPAKYRVPVVLCYLQGRTTEEAPRELGWPAGTVKGRLTRARALLRNRLTRRGLVLSAGLFAAEGVPALAAAAVPLSLAETALRGAVSFTAGAVAAG